MVGGWGIHRLNLLIELDMIGLGTLASNITTGGGLTPAMVSTLVFFGSHERCVGFALQWEWAVEGGRNRHQLGFYR